MEENKGEDILTIGKLAGTQPMPAVLEKFAPVAATVTKQLQAVTVLLARPEGAGISLLSSFFVYGD